MARLMALVIVCVLTGSCAAAAQGLFGSPPPNAPSAGGQPPDNNATPPAATPAPQEKPVELPPAAPVLPGS